MATNNNANRTYPIPVSDGGTGATTLTDHGVLIGSGTSAITASSAGTNGQLLVGATGANPAFATLTSTGSTVTFTAGAGTLNMEAATGLTAWEEVTDATKQMVNDAKYIANKSTMVSLKLPSTAAVGKTIAIVGKGSGKYKICQNASQNITFNAAVTPTGALGYLEADAQNNCLEMVCKVANTSWTVYSNIGTFTTGTSPGGEPTTWTQRATGYGSNAIYGVSTDGTYWTIGGNTNGLYTASDATSTWTSRSSSFGASACYGINYANSIWVAVGDGKIDTSTSPTSTWTNNSGYPFGASACWIAIYGSDGYWVLPANDGKMATATNPASTWTTRTIGFGTSRAFNSAYNGTYWTLVGQSGKMATATDPTGTWTSRNPGHGTDAIEGIYYWNGLWVICGQNGKLSTATDPTGTWTARTANAGTDYLYKIQSNEIDAWVYTDAAQAKVGTATDPTGTWTLRDSNGGSGMIWVKFGLTPNLWVATTGGNYVSTGTP